MRVLLPLVTEKIVATRKANVGATRYWAAVQLALGGGGLLMSTLVTATVFRVQESFGTKRALVWPFGATEMRLLVTSDRLLASNHD